VVVPVGKIDTPDKTVRSEIGSRYNCLFCEWPISASTTGPSPSIYPQKMK
jgi:hypothetical protein